MNNAVLRARLQATTCLITAPSAAETYAQSAWQRVAAGPYLLAPGWSLKTYLKSDETNLKEPRRRATGFTGRVCMLTATAVRGAPGGPRTRKNIAVRLILSQVCLPIPPPALRYCGARGRPRTCTSLARLQPLKLACLPIPPHGQCLCAAGCSVGLPAWPSWGPDTRSGLKPRANGCSIPWDSMRQLLRALP